MKFRSIAHMILFPQKSKEGWKDGRMHEKKEGRERGKEGGREAWKENPLLIFL